jgi:hypothetical protein
VTVISRAQHRLAPVCRAFLKHLHRVARPRAGSEAR